MLLLPPPSLLGKGLPILDFPAEMRKSPTTTRPPFGSRWKNLSTHRTDFILKTLFKVSLEKLRNGVGPVISKRNFPEKPQGSRSSVREAAAVVKPERRREKGVQPRRAPTAWEPRGSAASVGSCEL